MTISTAVPSKPTSKFSTGKKLLASAAIVGAVASIAALGSFASFGGSTSASQKVSTGSVGLEMPYSTFNAPVSDVLPGDTIERVATMTNTGSSALKEIVLSTTAVQSSALNADPVNGLQVSIETCSVPWTTNTGGPDACAGSVWTVIPQGPLSQLSGPIALTAPQAVNSGGSDYLLATFKLPSTADSTFQDLSSELNFQFDGIQRDAKFLDS